MWIPAARIVARVPYTSIVARISVARILMKILTTLIADVRVKVNPEFSVVTEVHKPTKLYDGRLICDVKNFESNAHINLKRCCVFLPNIIAERILSLRHSV